MMIRSLSTFGALACMIVIGGCGGITVTDEDGNTVEVSSDDGNLTLEGNDNETVISSNNDTISIESQNQDGSSTIAQAGENAALPENLPNEIPIYEDSKVVLAIENNTDEKDSFHVTLQRESADVEDVILFYESNFEEGGWQTEDRTVVDASGQKMVSIVVTKDDIHCSTTIVANEDNEVIINLIVEVNK